MKVHDAPPPNLHSLTARLENVSKASGVARNRLRGELNAKPATERRARKDFP